MFTFSSSGERGGWSLEGGGGVACDGAWNVLSRRFPGVISDFDICQMEDMIWYRNEIWRTQGNDADQASYEENTGEQWEGSCFIDYPFLSVPSPRTHRFNSNASLTIIIVIGIITSTSTEVKGQHPSAAKRHVLFVVQIFYRRASTETSREWCVVNSCWGEGVRWMAAPAGCSLFWWWCAEVKMSDDKCIAGLACLGNDRKRFLSPLLRKLDSFDEKKEMLG